MIKLSTKGRYGLRAMVELAPSFEGDPIKMNDIAKRQRLSRKYLHAILTKLKEAGLIEAVRGAKGGFRLIKDPYTLSVCTVFEVLEGPLAIVECVVNKEYCDHTETCPTIGLWRRINTSVSNILCSTTLAQMAHLPQSKTA